VLLVCVGELYCTECLLHECSCVRELGRCTCLLGTVVDDCIDIDQGDRVYGQRLHKTLVGRWLGSDSAVDKVRIMLDGMRKDMRSQFIGMQLDDWKTAQVCRGGTVHCEIVCINIKIGAMSRSNSGVSIVNRRPIEDDTGSLK
jgi:hypothetical protein